MATRSDFLLAALAALTAGGLAAIGAVAIGASHQAPAQAPLSRVVISGSGDITAPLRSFRRQLGPDNGGGPARRATGRREIDWDAVPDALASPAALPGDYFNAARAPRARGAVLRTPGDNVAVSADSANPAGAAVRFGDIHPSYARQFRTFSPERLFSPIGSNIVNLRFAVPGTRTAAAVRGFGAVYTGVDRARGTSFTYFDARGRSLGRFKVPVSLQGLSFLGVVFDRPIVARVRIEYGSGPLGRPDGPRYDAAVMDDFIYGEPRPLR